MNKYEMFKEKQAAIEKQQQRQAIEDRPKEIKVGIEFILKEVNDEINNSVVSHPHGVQKMTADGATSANCIYPICPELDYVWKHFRPIKKELKRYGIQIKRYHDFGRYEYPSIFEIGSAHIIEVKW